MAIIKYPQEVELFYILPAIRRQLAIFYKKRGLEQKKIAKLLEITEPAVSQYLRSKRASGIEFSKDIVKEIEQAALRIEKGGKVFEETQYLLNKVRNTKTTCEVCRKHTCADKSCEVCFE